MSKRMSLTAKGASKMANQIRSYWRTRGYNIDVWVEKVTREDFAVRSDLVDGLPPLAKSVAKSARRWEKGLPVPA